MLEVIGFAIITIVILIILIKFEKGDKKIK